MVPARLTVRPERQADLPAVHDVVAGAFGGEPVAALLDGPRRSTAWRGLSFVAEVDGLVAGHVSFTRGWLDAPQRLVEVLVLSPPSVRPELQRQGVGSALVRASLARLEQQRPEPLVFLQGVPCLLRAPRLPGRGAARLHPSVDADPCGRLPGDAAFGPPGLDGGALVYPDVFWEHDSVGLRGGAPG